MALTNTDAGAGGSAAGARGRTSPPGPPRTRTIRLLRQLLGDRLALMKEAADEYGDEVRLAVGPKTLYFFNHPDYAKHILTDNSDNYHKGIGLHQARRALGDGLLTSEGEQWRRQRRVMQPAFQAKRIARQADAVAEEAATVVARLRALIGAGPVNITGELTVLTLGVLGRTLLDEDLSGHDGIGHAFEAVQDQAMFEMLSLGAVPTFLPLPRQLRFRRARAQLEQVVRDLAAAREHRPTEDGEDVLSRLIGSVREEPDPRVGRRRMRDELITLLLAGHETTASTLSWALHLVGRDPGVGRRLREEARRVLGERNPVYEDLHQLTYTSMVVEEAMRLYPPVWMLSRIAQGPDEIGGYRIPAGAARTRRSCPAGATPSPGSPRGPRPPGSRPRCSPSRTPSTRRWWPRPPTRSATGWRGRSSVRSPGGSTPPSPAPRSRTARTSPPC
jgi:enediyne biosynthesis protein E7